MTDKQFCEWVRLKGGATGGHIAVIQRLMEATDRLAQAADERDDAKKVCAAASKTLEEMIDNDEVTGAVRGDLDNIRLDLLLASEGKR